MGRLASFLVSLSAGCAAQMPTSNSEFVAGFDPPAAPTGYERYVAPAILGMKPGDDLNNCQWLADPADTDRLAVDVTGVQSKGGHHLALYATKLHEAVGTSRICTQDDMLNISFIGAIGG